MKTIILTDWQIKFRNATDKRKTELKETPEEIFRNALNSLPKKIQENWRQISFDFHGNTFLIMKHWLIETNFNFELSHEILQ